MTPKPKPDPNACRWCGTGTYQVLVNPEHGNFRNLGLGGSQPEKWKVLRCASCGHVQWFREA